MNDELLPNVNVIVGAYRSGAFGELTLPEDSNPGFSPGESEQCLAYFTLPMALNYRRNSQQLWEAALRTHQDTETRWVFSPELVAGSDIASLRNALVRHRLALQPTRHTANWMTICVAIHGSWGSFTGLLVSAQHDYMKLKGIVQGTAKSSFPYLSGPKLFNYWAYILNTRTHSQLESSSQIDIAVDAHILKASVRLSVITETESTTLAREEVARRWRSILDGTSWLPTDLNVPLWRWSQCGLPDVHQLKMIRQSTGSRVDGGVSLSASSIKGD